MSTPVHEQEQYSFPAFEPDPGQQQQRRSTNPFQRADQDLFDDEPLPDNHLKVTTSYASGPDFLRQDDRSNISMSPSGRATQDSRRLDDDLEVLRAERYVREAAEKETEGSDMGRSRSVARSRTRNPEPLDDFDVDTTPIHERAKLYSPPQNPANNFAKAFKRIHNSSFLVRYFCYIIPVMLLLAIPVLLGQFVFTGSTVGGVRLFWFGIWLEIVWLTLWLARIISKSIPVPLGVISSLFTNNSKKWRDLGKALEVPCTLFFWMLAVEISFLPTMKQHHLDGNKGTRSWETSANKVIISLFVGAALNFLEKILIQLIAISFHRRTYSDRIDINKFQISSLVKLYTHSKNKINMDDSEFEQHPDTGLSSGNKTPMIMLNKAQKKTRHAFHKVGDAAGRVAGDFTGKAVASSTHPHQVILQLLHTTSGSQVLARRLYRTYAHEDSQTILPDDLRDAFDSEEETDAAFSMFDKDLNGDISMEELEAVCVEIGRERKAITASLKDLDSVVSKLDNVFLFFVIIITLLVFISLISTSAAGVLTSAGSTLLALSWLFSITAQEFLQSCIFVFVKHPFDVGDRVTIYGNTGSTMKGDDYFVKEISLLFTEFKKMEGHQVQAPNNYLNTLFILNQRRSGGLAESIPVTVKFGTTLEQIEGLRERLLEFVRSENREYQNNILTELTTISQAYSVTFNVVFFYKSNWQNELLRLQRRNKFVCALMVSMEQVGMQGPWKLDPGAAEANPTYLYPMPLAGDTTEPVSGPAQTGPGPRAGSLARSDTQFVSGSDVQSEHGSLRHHPSILRNRGLSTSRFRGESISAMGKRVDFSLGMSSISSGANPGDVYEDNKPRLPPVITTTSPSPRPGSAADRSEDGSLARTTSRDTNDPTSPRTHRNRFFKRSKLGSAEEGTDLDDLEAGTSRRFNLRDMTIPESRNGSIDWERSEKPAEIPLEGITIPRSAVQSEVPQATVSQPIVGSSRIDPRSGIVSPQAVMTDSARDRGELPTMSSMQ